VRFFREATPYATVYYKMEGIRIFLFIYWYKPAVWMDTDELLSYGGLLDSAKEITSAVNSKYGRLKYKHLLEAKNVSYHELYED